MEPKVSLRLLVLRLPRDAKGSLSVIFARTTGNAEFWNFMTDGPAATAQKNSVVRGCM